MSAEHLLQCYNKGCGQKFDSSTNAADACQYHPGEPVFHDAEKLWSCCNQRSKDFTEFLSMPGCSKGAHNPGKTPEPTKHVPVVEPKTEPKKPPYERKPRPSFESHMLVIQPTITSSLEKVLVKEVDSDADNDEEAVDPKTGIKIGEPCKRNGCKKSYEDAASNLQLCQHHPGCPVFHEGLKFWSCCNRKTTDFTEFLAQPGCSTDKHVWLDDSQPGGRNTECRHDWHQTPSDVVVTIYAKGAMPGMSSVTVNPVRLTVMLRYAGELQCHLDMALEGLIDPAQCTASFAANKVEITLKKAEYIKWSRLYIERRKTNDDQREQNGNTAEEDLDLDVDAVDLSDL